MGSRNLNPIEAIPGEDVFGVPVHPGQAIAMATKSGGCANINKGRYLGQRKTSGHWNKDFKCYIVEQDLVRRERTNAAGEEWLHYAYGEKEQEIYNRQRDALAAVAGEDPGYCFRNKNNHRYGSPEYIAAKKIWRATYDEYASKRDAWLDEHYPYKSTPYVRRSTLWLNRIIKL